MPAQEANYSDVLRQEVDDKMCDVRIHLKEITQAYNKSLAENKEIITNLLKECKKLESENRKKDIKIALLEDRLNQEKRNQSTGNELNQYKQLVFILNEKLTNLENQLNSRIQKEEKELMEETDLDELMFCGIEMPIDCPQSTQLGDEFQSWAGGRSDSDTFNRTAIETPKDSSSKFSKFIQALKAYKNKRNTRQSKRLNSGFVTKKN